MKGTKSAAQPGGAKKSYVKRELEDPTGTYITSIIIAFSHTTDDDTAGGGTGGVDKLVIANVDAHMTGVAYNIARLCICKTAYVISASSLCSRGMR